MTNLASRIDHTLLRAEAGSHDVQRIVAEALHYGFASVCVHGRFVAEAAKALHGSRVKACAVAGFPHGAGKAAVKAIEAVAAAKDGAQEIDFVAHLPHLLARDVPAAKEEFTEIVRAARAVNPALTIKVIIESALLMTGVGPVEAESRLECACRAARESGCDFVKTSTGFHPAGGATLEAVQLLRKHARGLYVKAAGGIRTAEDARRMVEAGADRLGTSAGVEIVRGVRPASGDY